MSLFNKLSSAFSNDKPATSGERDQVIRETTKKTRLMKDQEWIKNKGDDSQNLSVDVNYGKKALNPVKSEGSPFRDSTGTSKVTTTKRGDTLDGRKSGSTTNLNKAPWTSSQEKLASGGTTNLNKAPWTSSQEKLARDKESTDVTSPTKRYSSTDRLNRLSTGVYDELPKMTIVTSETKVETPTSKSSRLQTRPSPDGQVTTLDKTSTTTILKSDGKKVETLPNVNTSKTSTLERKTVKTPTKSESLIDLTPTTEKTSKGSSVLLPTLESKSLIDLSVTSDKTNDRNSGDWGNTTSYTTSTKTTFDPNTGRNSGDWDNITSSTTSSTKSSFDSSSPTKPSGDWANITSSTTSSTKLSLDSVPKKSSRSSGDWGNTTSYTTSTKATFDPKAGRNSGDWDNITSSTTSSTKSSFDSSSPTKPRFTNEKDLLNDESTYKSPTSYTKTSKTYSYNSNNNQSPAVDEHPYTSQSSYKENSPPYDDDDESSSYQSSKYSQPKTRSSSSSFSDAKTPAQVITLTTAYTSAGQTTRDKNVCSQCYKPFNGDPKMILEDLNINCHASCLKCQICNRSLEDLSAGDNLWVHHRTVHCERCYDNAKAQLGY